MAFAAGCAKNDPRELAPKVEHALDGSPVWVDDDAAGKRLWKLERKFYAARQFTPAWFDGTKPTKPAGELLEALKASGKHGLDPARYSVQGLDAAAKKVSKEQVPDLDVHLTYAFFRHAADLLGGTSSPKRIDDLWVAADKDVDLAQGLRKALDAKQVRAALDALAPAHAQYRALQAALEEARQKGDRAAEEKLVMNLERWRWAPRDLGERHLLVNVPAYELQVVEKEKPVLAMRVVVGKPDAPTPLFSDEMGYVVFSPFWNIPEQILREETLPKLARDPDYLVRSGIEAVTASGEPVDVNALDWSDEKATANVRLRQIPGPDNALGLVKFMFPNHFNVYLHDTPEAALFQKPQRAFSHGCIRVERPIDLARYVLPDREKWSDERIAQAMNAGVEEWVTMKEKLPVHIGYYTAWVNADGKLVFTDDPYGIDARHAAVRRGQAPPEQPRRGIVAARKTF